MKIVNVYNDICEVLRRFKHSRQQRNCQCIEEKAIKR